MTFQFPADSGPGNPVRIGKNWTGYARLRWLPRVSTKMTIRTGKTCKRSPSSVVLQSLFLIFTSKVTNIITLTFQVLLLRQAVFMATKHLKNDRYFPLIRLFS